MNPGIKTEPIPFSRPSITDEEEQAVLRVLRSGWITTAGETAAFEKEWSVRHEGLPSLAVSSATAGLHLALEAFGIGPGDKILTTPYTFTATAEVARYLGAEVVFADIRDDDFNLDPGTTERGLKAERGAVKAIVPVHIGGNPCDMKAFCDLGERFGAKVIEDAAHAFPGTLDSRPLGTWGDAGVFSFYANKTITTAEGGMVVLKDDEAAERIRLMRLHGIDRSIWDRFSNPRASWDYDVIEPGYKYNMTDLSGALGRVQLGRAEELKARRRAIMAAYDEGLRDCDFLRRPKTGTDSSGHLYMVRLIPERLSLDRDQFCRRLQKEGIGISVHYKPLHIMPYYRDRYGLKPEDYPRSYEAYLREFSLPLSPDQSESQTERVIEAVKSLGAEALRG